MTYIVQPGDTLYSIAIRFNTTVNAIVLENNISDPNMIYPGQILRIPESNTSPDDGFDYVVHAGDTLYSIAQRYNISLRALITANRISPPYNIYPGQKIFIPGAKSPEPPPGGQIYVVKAGDTLYSIAEQFNVTIDAIIRLNNIPRPDLIYPGQRLIIPQPVR